MPSMYEIIASLVKVQSSNETAIADYEETTEDVFADIRWELEMEEFRSLYVS